MYNVAFQAMNNIPMEKEQKPMVENNTSLLARSPKPDAKSKEENIRQRIARYTNTLRKARMELNNG